ncbi:TerC family protein [Neisseria sp. Ec49-e6-T10]|uniref:TerC family protein n=1 Tax=Neisseria sp. Ec49-e6-T10 TaxID=3140744 RepID=UPI003EBA13DB
MNHLSIGTPLFYTVFFIIIFIMIAIDILALKKNGSHKVNTKEALVWTVIWVIVSVCFAGWLYFELANDPNYGTQIAHEKVLEYFTGYVLEKSLAIDNIFVFLLIFSYFKVPSEWQHRVLIYGVFGAIILRAIMIGAGAVLVREFSEILYVFGAFLIYTGFKMLKPEAEHSDLGNNKLLKWVERRIRLTKEFHQERFFVKQDGLLYATPLLLVLIMIELSDVIFAVDSIPAIFAVTTDPFIVLTSNIFAILGLRAMYFLLADVADRFEYLKYGLAIVLMFIGCKMLIVEWFHVPVILSLAVIFTVIGSSIALSLFKTRSQS